MLGHQLSCVVQVPRFQEQNPADLFLALGVGAIGDDNLPASAPHGYCILGRLECFSTQEMPSPAKLVVIRETLLQEGFAFAFGHLGRVGLVVESQAKKLHIGTPQSMKSAPPHQVVVLEGGTSTWR
jgi:hypothetical protein